MLPRTLNHVMRDDLYTAMSTGEPILLFDHAIGSYLLGRIMGLSLESGFIPPARPRHFNVSLYVQDATARMEYNDTTREVYVKTAD